METNRLSGDIYQAILKASKRGRESFNLEVVLQCLDREKLGVTLEELGRRVLETFSLFSAAGTLIGCNDSVRAEDQVFSINPKLLNVFVNPIIFRRQG